MRASSTRAFSRPALAAATAAALALIASAPTHAAPGTPKLALDGHDPVALCEGREVKGSASDSLAHGRFVYRFESVANKEKFLADPIRWGIQNGGACGKMGVLSGQGSPSRWYVQDGRVYVFASDICRERFRGEPQAFIHRPDSVPSPSQREREDARRALDRAAKAYGKNFDKLTSLELRIAADYRNRDSTISTGRQLHQWQFPDRYREHEEWPTITYGHAVNGASSHQFDGAVEWVDDAAVHGVVEQLMWREPLLLVRARRDLVARHVGTEQVGDEQADLVEVAKGGATTVLAIGVKSGRVLEARFPARTNFGDRPVVQRYSDFRSVAGLQLPHASARFENGEPSRSPLLRLESASANVTFAPGHFEPTN